MNAEFRCSAPGRPGPRMTVKGMPTSPFPYTQVNRTGSEAIPVTMVD
jgi:hypothetical protein